MVVVLLQPRPASWAKTPDSESPVTIAKYVSHSKSLIVGMPMLRYTFTLKHLP